MPRKILLAVVIGLLPAVTAFGQADALTGRVTNAQTGEPVDGARLAVAGTVVEAYSREDGTFAVGELQTGSYEVRISRAGFAPAVRHVELPGAPSSLSIELQPGLDPRSAFAGHTVYASEMRSGRYRDVTDVLADVPGVAAVGAYSDEPGLRGGAWSKADLRWNGFRMRDPLTHYPYPRMGLNAAERIRVRHGAFDVEYGDARSGVIEVTTRKVGDEYLGHADAQYRPPGRKHFGPMMFGFDSPVVEPYVDREAGAFSGNRFFPGWEAMANRQLPEGDPHYYQQLREGDPHYGEPDELYALWLWRHRSPDAIAELKQLEEQGVVQFAPDVDPDEAAFHRYGYRPDHRGGVTLGGPVPFVPATFLASYDTERTVYAYPFAQSAYQDRHWQGHIGIRPTPRLKLDLYGLWGSQAGMSSDYWPQLTGLITNNPFQAPLHDSRLWDLHAGLPQYQARRLLGAEWTHELPGRGRYALQFSHHSVDYDTQREHRHTVPIPGTDFTALKEGRLGTAEEADRMAERLDWWQGWRDWARIRIGDIWYDETPRRYSPLFSADTFGEYYIGGSPFDTNRTASQTAAFAAQWHQPLGSRHQLKSGLEVRTTDMYMYHTRVHCCEGRLSTSHVRPWKGALFVQDTYTNGDVTAAFGLRADGMLHGRFPLLGGEDEETGPYSPPFRSGSKPDPEAYLLEHIPPRPVADLRISPRLQAAYRLSSTARLAAGFGHFYQWPRLYDLYHVKYGTSCGNRVLRLGNPRLSPPRRATYEGRYEQLFFSRVLMQLTGYYSDISNEVADARYHPEEVGGCWPYSGFYEMPHNMGHGEVKGMEAALRIRRGLMPYVSGGISLDYRVEQRGQFGYRGFFEDPERAPTPAPGVPVRSDVRPRIKGHLGLRTPPSMGPGTIGELLLGGWEATLHYTWQQGARFTWNPAEIPGVENNVRWRPYRRWDLRLTKEVVSVGHATSALYLDVVNLLNQRNMTPPVGEQDVTGRPGWAWDMHYGFDDQRQAYMESLDLEVQADGSVTGTQRPGDWQAPNIQLPGFTPWTFLERRELSFGLRVAF